MHTLIKGLVSYVGGVKSIIQKYPTSNMLIQASFSEKFGFLRMSGFLPHALFIARVIGKERESDSESERVRYVC